ncbi:MAG: Uma2 family endonuclease [Myxacorys californica WJT36-NPBG1]|jgi:Uma2 family endonuclease|nr:Uma2 family endonuclease [Myxacorys californica WJT36-NPBG1]
MTQLIGQTGDQHTIHHDRSWEQFKLIQKGFEGSPGVRLFFYSGTIEILTPGSEHEFFKGIIGMLIEIFFLEKEIEFAPTGAVTQEKEGIASAQADESYCIGSLKPIPDFSIEVVFTSGGVSKLERYRLLEVPEVWFWEDGLFSVYRLRRDAYERIDGSEVPELADLDFELLARCVLIAQTSRLAAAQEFRRAIQSK